MKQETEIKFVALDIYGTLLVPDDWDCEIPARKGLEKFFDNCKSFGIKVVSTSDSEIADVKSDLRRTFELTPERKLSLDRFDKFIRLDQPNYKDFKIVIEHYNINPSQLLVIGDSDKDIIGAIRAGAGFIAVPVYRSGDYSPEGNFDFGKINLRKIKRSRISAFAQ